MREHRSMIEHESYGERGDSRPWHTYLERLDQDELNAAADRLQSIRSESEFRVALNTMGPAIVQLLTDNKLGHKWMRVVYRALSESFPPHESAEKQDTPAREPAKIDLHKAAQGVESEIRGIEDVDGLISFVMDALDQHADYQALFADEQNGDQWHEWVKNKLIAVATTAEAPEETGGEDALTDTEAKSAETTKSPYGLEKDAFLLLDEALESEEIKEWTPELHEFATELLTVYTTVINGKDHEPTASDKEQQIINLVPSIDKYVFTQFDETRYLEPDYRSEPWAVKAMVAIRALQGQCMAVLREKHQLRIIDARAGMEVDKTNTDYNIEVELSPEGSDRDEINRVTLNGYYLGDRLLRQAGVKILKRPERRPRRGSSNEETEE